MFGELGDEEGKLLIRKTNRGTDAESVNLVEFSLSTDAPLNQLGITKIQLGSSIAAYYDPDKEKRYIIYQDANSKNLYEYGVNDESCKLFRPSYQVTPTSHAKSKHKTSQPP